MTKIESKKRSIKQTKETIFNFLSNFNNFEGLMPEKVTNWTSDEESCYFSISGIASLGMRIIETSAHSRIKMVDDGKVPFKFFFTVNLEGDKEQTIVQLVFDAELNAMLKMVAVKPLNDFLESLLDHLENHKF